MGKSSSKVSTNNPNVNIEEDITLDKFMGAKLNNMKNIVKENKTLLVSLLLGTVYYTIKNYY